MKKKRNQTKYPAATIAFYGPDNMRATKVVASIIISENAEPNPMKKWVSGLTDVRGDERILSEIEAFIKDNGVKSVIATEGIIGCPHEEGLDYPEGINCPLCSFWSNRDRFTHEIE